MQTAWVDGLANVITVSRRHIFDALTTGGGTDEIEEATGTPVTIEDDGAVHCVPGNTGWGRATDLAGHVYFYRSISSTNDRLRELAARGVPQGTIVVTEEQTAGRGRINRVWFTPKGGLALSVVLYPSMVYLPSLIMVASLAVVHAIAAVTGLQSQVKWPNDVLINGRKVCGILIESGVWGNTVDYAIMGIGINVNLRTSDFAEIASTATSLSDELGREVSRLKLSRKLLVEVERLYLSVQSGGSVYQEWRDSLVTLGRKVGVSLGKIVYEGTAESVAEDGSLLLRCPDGSLTRIPAGDVTLRD